MRFHSVYQPICIIIILTIYQVCLADESQKETVSVIPSYSENSPIAKEVTEFLREKLKSKNLLNDSPLKWELLIAVRQIEQNSIAIAVTILQTMPREVIEAGSKSQIIYAFLEKDKSPNRSDQNQEIREYVTSEFLSNYKQVIESEILITQKDNIEDTCSNIVDNFINKYLK
jgi:hypothetical protein